MNSNDPPPAGVPRLSPSVAVARAGVRVPLALKKVEAIARHVLRAEGTRQAHLGITFVTMPAIARIHRSALGVAGATDIVTLEHRRPPGTRPVGEVFISPAAAAGNARRYDRPVREEVARLVIHGTLHALGWTHPSDRERESSPMWRRQESLLRTCRRAGLF